jgi:hypothetical protein
MAKKEIGRREFLKIALGSAAAAGLSHFRFVNLGGAGPALAIDVPDSC